MAYETTTVAVEKSQAELRKMLTKHGAETFGFHEARIGDQRHAEIFFEAAGFAVRMRVPYKRRTDAELRDEARRTRTGFDRLKADEPEREARRIWRVLYWLLKTRMEAIEEGVETFTEAFLPHLLDRRTDRTVYEAMVEQNALRQLEAGSDDPDAEEAECA